MFRFRKSLMSRALCLGTVAGLRSQMPNAALALSYDQQKWFKTGWRSWPVFRNVWGRRLLVLGAAGELIGDKLPRTPARIAPNALAGRAAFGALAGAAIGSEYRGKRTLMQGAACGLVGSLAGSYGGYSARQTAGRITGLPDPVVALGEDAIAITLAAFATHRG